MQTGTAFHVVSVLILIEFAHDYRNGYTRQGMGTMNLMLREGLGIP